MPLYSSIKDKRIQKIVYISQKLRAALQGIVRPLDTSYMFMDKHKKRFGKVVGSFKAASGRAGIKGFRFHDLRHSFASQPVMAGIDRTALKEFLGHKGYYHDAQICPPCAEPLR